MKWMRSIVSMTNGVRPRLPSGAYGVIKLTRTAHGTTRSISARNSRLRVRLVVRPRSACFMAQILDAQTPLISTSRRDLRRPSLK